MIDGYRLILASSVGERDGIALELDQADGERVAEVFEHDETGARTLTVFREHRVPIEAIEWLLSEARAAFGNSPSHEPTTNGSDVVFISSGRGTLENSRIDSRATSPEVSKRVELLHDLVHRRQPLAETISQLRAFTWDSESLAVVTAHNVIAVLEDFLASRMSAHAVEVWADSIECRDDVRPDTDATLETISVLANPKLEGELSRQTVEMMIAGLRP
jgi:hypothetical protein